MSNATLRLQMQMSISSGKGGNTNKRFGRYVTQVRPDIDTTLAGVGHFRHKTDTYAFSQPFRLKVGDVTAEALGQQVVIQYEVTDVLKIGTRNTNVPGTFFIKLHRAEAKFVKR